MNAASKARRPLRVLIAPDSFKGSFSSVDVAAALARGWVRARPDDGMAIAPLADGGEGTLGAIAAAGGWSWRDAIVGDPLGRPVRARWLRRDDGKAAVVELAEASGLSRVRPSERDPLSATTLGTGEVIRAVLDDGIRHITLGIGGSATTDGGAGILRALGADFTRWPEIDLSALDPRLAEVELRIACDVTNPLLGDRGAAATYGPQKGATPDQVRKLDAYLGVYADALEAATGRHERDVAGAGAAGGTAFGLLTIGGHLRSIELRPGVDLVLEETGAAERLASADLVVTGEGRIDEQTAYGKTALGVARRANDAGVACIAVGGGVTVEGIAALADVGAVAVPVIETPATLEEAIAAGTRAIERCGERLARLVTIGADHG
ncbi:MAG: glycerate kinase [Chloroflexota bacterium]